eukprot:GFKZ01015962.1.p1 GENE.GFKZ01015962.1~~GFKZ01015962.1.p1  ORF type:complete len:592 (+),score=79.64 GFKZ01015962.1:329-2104(+)
MRNLVLLLLVIAVFSIISFGQDAGGSTDDADRNDPDSADVDPDDSENGDAASGGSTATGQQPASDDGAGIASNNGTEPQPASPHPTSSSPDSDSNSTAPDSPMASLYVFMSKPGLGSSIATSVFKESHLVAPYNSCRLATGDSTRLDEKSDCFIDDEFNDRVTFEIIYRVHPAAIQKSFDNHPPALLMLGDSAQNAESNISSTVVELADSTAKIFVEYRCRSGKNGEISLQLRLQIADGETNVLEIFWKKKCQSGPNSAMEFGYVVQDKDTGEQEHHEFPTEADAPYIVAPGDVSTEMYLKLTVPGAQQTFLAPFVYPRDPDIVTVSVRGNHPKGGVLQGLQASTIQLNYECAMKGSSDVLVSVGIPPFNNVTTTFEKECGGNIASQLRIGNEEGGSDIVDQGKPTSKYMVSIDHIGTEHSEEHLHLPGNQSDWTIFLSNADGDGDGAVAKDSAVYLGRIGVTVEKHDVIAAVTPSLSVRGSLGWRDAGNLGSELYPGDNVRLSFHFACKRKGESRLLITIPLRDYDNLEFGIAKECDHEASAHKSRQWVLTVDNVFWGTSLIFLGALAVYCLRRRGKDSPGFTRVPVEEQ